MSKKPSPYHAYILKLVLDHNVAQAFFNIKTALEADSGQKMTQEAVFEFVIAQVYKYAQKTAEAKSKNTEAASQLEAAVKEGGAIEPGNEVTSEVYMEPSQAVESTGTEGNIG